MPDGGSLSELVGDAVAGDIAVLGQAPAAAMAATYIASAGSVALVMQNAAAQQQRAQVLATAATSIVLARILIAPFKTGAPP